MHIFMIGMGGSVPGANIEVHDMQFALAKTKEEAFKIVQKRWYGDSLHIDSFMKIEYIDGYKVLLDTKPKSKVFMIVYGGYQKGTIDELHDYHFVLANSKEEAKKLGKLELERFDMDHVDSVVDVFENVGVTFGLKEGNYQFKDNVLTHTFIKLQ